MTPAEYAHVSILWAILSVSGAGVAQLVKTPIKLRQRRALRLYAMGEGLSLAELQRLIDGKVRPSRMTEAQALVVIRMEEGTAAYRWGVRVLPMPVLIATAWASQWLDLGLWPGVVSAVWGVLLLPVTAALCSPLVYHAFKGEIGEVIDSLSDAVRKWLGIIPGAASERAAVTTTEIPTLAGSMPDELPTVDHEVEWEE